MSKTKFIKIEGLNDTQISYEDVVKLAFDPSTNEKNAKQYQALLINLKKIVDEQSIDWKFFHFVLRPGSKEIRAWF